MAQAYARFSEAIQLLADATSSLLKYVLGTPGDTIQYPESGTGATTRDTGSMWDGVVMPAILSGIGDEFDRSSCVWAEISTNGIAIAPTIATGTGVSAVSKNEALDRLTVTFDPAYTNANFYAHAIIEQMEAFTIIVGRSVDTLTVQFQDRTGALLDINTRNVLVFACGQM